MSRMRRTGEQVENGVVIDATFRTGWRSSAPGADKERVEVMAVARAKLAEDRLRVTRELLSRLIDLREATV